MGKRLRKIKRVGLTLALCGGCLNAGLCANSANFKEFRASAGPGLESGVQALLDGDASGFDTLVDNIVSGLFDIFEPDADSGN